VLVVQRVFRAKRTNLHEKYDYPMKRLAKTCNKNLDTAFAALFPETLQASLALSVAA